MVPKGVPNGPQPGRSLRGRLRPAAVGRHWLAARRQEDVPPLPPPSKRGVVSAPGYVHGALVHGVSAHVLDRLLASPDVVRLFAAMPPWMRPELEATRRAVRLAAREYESLPAAERGSTETPAVEVGPVSPQEISTYQASVLLGVGERRVRQLAASGMGRLVAGRWLLDRSAVLAYAQHRRGRRGLAA